MDSKSVQSMRKYADAFREYTVINKKMISKVKREIPCEDDIVKTAELLEQLSKSLLEFKLDYVDMIEEEL